MMRSKKKIWSSFALNRDADHFFFSSLFVVVNSMAWMRIRCSFNDIFLFWKQPEKNRNNVHFNDIVIITFAIDSTSIANKSSTLKVWKSGRGGEIPIKMTKTTKIILFWEASGWGKGKQTDSILKSRQIINTRKKSSVKKGKTLILISNLSGKKYSKSSWSLKRSFWRVHCTMYACSCVRINVCFRFSIFFQWLESEERAESGREFLKLYQSTFINISLLIDSKPACASPKQQWCTICLHTKTRIVRERTTYK